jgi:hypothetical protein
MDLANRQSIPGAVQIPATSLLPPIFHLIASYVTLVTGLLQGGTRVQVFDSSTLQELPFSKEELNELGRMNTPTLG